MSLQFSDFGTCMVQEKFNVPGQLIGKSEQELCIKKKT
jgi:hypothetical protein